MIFKLNWTIIILIATTTEGGDTKVTVDTFVSTIVVFHYEITDWNIRVKNFDVRTTKTTTTTTREKEGKISLQFFCLSVAKRGVVLFLSTTQQQEVLCCSSVLYLSLHPSSRQSHKCHKKLFFTIRAGESGLVIATGCD